MADPVEVEPVFTHEEQGTREDEWFSHPVWGKVPAVLADELPLEGIERLLVLAAHPDDETIGAGATIAALAATGLAVHFLLATVGERSHPDSPVWSSEDLAAQRRAEWEAATDALAGAGVRRTLLGLPDGQVADHEEALLDAVLEHLRPGTLLLAPWTEDGHPDHDAVGRVAREAARRNGASGISTACLHYPVWWWHWNRPEQVREHLTTAAVLVEPGPDAVRAKHRALELYPSQQTGLGPGAHHGPVVTPEVVARARRAFEVFFSSWRPTPGDEASRAGTFDEMYEAGDDPWGWEESWYERRRRALVLGILRRPEYRHVLELGCGTGLLTAELVRRSEAVTALDVSGRALEVAHRRGIEGVDWVHAAVPDGLPEGRFDCVVISELGYFLRPSELLALVRTVRDRMTDDAELVLADWRHPTQGIPLDGPLVHELVDAVVGLPRWARYEDPDVLVEAWSSAESPATAEGLV
ncbi:hypothetical protein GCM10027030_28740 [Luteococcus sediminum]